MGDLNLFLEQAMVFVAYILVIGLILVGGFGVIIFTIINMVSTRSLRPVNLLIFPVVGLLMVMGIQYMPSIVLRAATESLTTLRPESIALMNVLLTYRPSILLSEVDDGAVTPPALPPTVDSPPVMDTPEPVMDTPAPIPTEAFTPTAALTDTTTPTTPETPPAVTSPPAETPTPSVTPIDPAAWNQLTPVVVVPTP